MLVGQVQAAPGGEARVARMFADNMVLQREMPVPVWGWVAPGTAVEIRFAGQTKQGTAGPDGRWQVVLDQLPASNEGRNLDIRIGDESFSIRNVLVGEVWIASGQSNIDTSGPDEDTGLYPLYVSPKPETELPEVRIMRHGLTRSSEPLADLPEEAVTFQRGNTLWSNLWSTIRR
ncbi:MAG: hypothetical protein ABSG68_07970 [Thermoguttaceae bacterium]